MVGLRIKKKKALMNTTGLAYDEKEGGDYTKGEGCRFRSLL
jgi:hypothetical protein